MSARRLTATLPRPVGVNRSYRSTRGGRWYMTDRATGWQQSAVLLLRQAGWRSLPAGACWIGQELVLSTMALDLDGPLKLVIDAVQVALGVDDRAVGLIIVRKVPVSLPVEQRLDIAATIHALDDPGEFATLSLDGLDTTPAAVQR